MQKIMEEITVGDSCMGDGSH
nr:hypothetical protein Itr_chr02CG03080 [Ipomoea trifida]